MSSQDSQAFNWHYNEIDDRNLQIKGRTLFFIIVLLSVILLVTLLFLYARWVCRYQYHLPTTLDISDARHAPPATPQGLDPASIKKLPIILHQTPSDSNCALEDTECCICLGEFKDGDKLKVLPGCDHSFHSECVDKWLINHSSCPLCRASLKPDSCAFPRILIPEPPIRINIQF
ncbi:hypothetical protein L6164_029747 [Bauhinia variegata]|uniref:Uncharacterized protein n=1 Tax=Bauhinia variegata TaxID=167791 RepID=A0ACB9LAJ0_BAUVA|nr:hypothetical protein L6164_029747 [Bauhinia variegata]